MQIFETYETWESERMDPHLDDDKMLLTARADRARTRLSAALSALDRRRHEALDLPLQVTKHAGAVAAVAAVCVAGVVVMGIFRAATAARRRRRERWLVVRRVWAHPERIAQPEETLMGRVARVAAVGLARFVLSRVLAAAEHEGEKEPPLLPAPIDRL